MGKGMKVLIAMGVGTLVIIFALACGSANKTSEGTKTAPAVTETKTPPVKTTAVEPIDLIALSRKSPRAAADYFGCALSEKSGSTEYNFTGVRPGISVAGYWRENGGAPLCIDVHFDPPVPASRAFAVCSLPQLPVGYDFTASAPGGGSYSRTFLPPLLGPDQRISAGWAMDDAYDGPGERNVLIIRLANSPDEALYK